MAIAIPPVSNRKKNVSPNPSHFCGDAVENVWKWRTADIDVGGAIVLQGTFTFTEVSQ